MKGEELYVYVGKKPLMSYVLAAVMQINSDAREVVIKARGKAISRAVDVAEILRNKFVQSARVKDIRISTESLASEQGGQTNVSSIEIVLVREEGEAGSQPTAPPQPLKTSR
ncbi:MAG: DNA-binding protein Alba [Thermoplasmata archaeon]